MTSHEQQARAIWSKLISTTPLLTDEESIDAIASALRECEAMVWEEAADLIEVMELADPSGLSRREQLRIYDIIQKLADLCRQRAGKEGG